MNQDDHNSNEHKVEKQLHYYDQEWPQQPPSLSPRFTPQQCYLFPPQNMSNFNLHAEPEFQDKNKPKYPFRKLSAGDAPDEEDQFRQPYNPYYQQVPPQMKYPQNNPFMQMKYPVPYPPPWYRHPYPPFYYPPFDSSTSVQSQPTCAILKGLSPFNAIARKANVQNYTANASPTIGSAHRAAIAPNAKIESTIPMKDQKPSKKPYSEIQKPSLRSSPIMANKHKSSQNPNRRKNKARKPKKDAIVRNQNAKRNIVNAIVLIKNVLICANAKTVQTKRNHQRNYLIQNQIIILQLSNSYKNRKLSKKKIRSLKKSKKKKFKLKSILKIKKRKKRIDNHFYVYIIYHCKKSNRFLHIKLAVFLGNIYLRVIYSVEFTFQIFHNFFHLLNNRTQHQSITNNTFFIVFIIFWNWLLCLALMKNFETNNQFPNPLNNLPCVQVNDRSMPKILKELQTSHSQSYKLPRKAQIHTSLSFPLEFYSFSLFYPNV
ncbi:unnamed protein product (macronuclear) [Paramecium tetraurelia]|uniref:Uncharacterized protein n=1 Tax=Paramecium tetraurelia TaxID=5888 RepID=A0D1A4_PARTE|nr:uncharacterized protein GSPATT00012345001 [Paramecium tetraurelia]CAK76821.1 unnamed protein product [Paramecium tetraurelia]|eukprot:XP_001444218.1 hypothetical protein (macronuclear) [Paramecium tetraurelia strain d4-2]